jgi:hypothetical protein
MCTCLWFEGNHLSEKQTTDSFRQETNLIMARAAIRPSVASNHSTVNQIRIQEKELNFSRALL